MQRHATYIDHRLACSPLAFKQMKEDRDPILEPKGLSSGFWVLLGITIFLAVILLVGFARLVDYFMKESAYISRFGTLEGFK